VAVQISALAAALATAFVLTWTEKRWPEVQEAIIGVVFVLGASGAILLLWYALVRYNESTEKFTLL
jgi:zinc/manganese transport system permease protein